MVRLLIRLVFLLLKLAMLPLKILRAGITFVTCILPLVLLIGIVVLALWFFLIR